MNSVNLTARIVSELELTQAGSTELCKFSVAINEKYNGEEKSHFFDVVSFGKQAQFIVNYCKKGGRIEITGKLQQQRWETQEGQKRSKVEIIVREINPIDWKDQDSSPSTNTVETEIEDNPFSTDQIPF